MLRNDQLDHWDLAHFFHPSTHLGQFARGEMQNRIIAGGEAEDVAKTVVTAAQGLLPFAVGQALLVDGGLTLRTL